MAVSVIAVSVIAVSVIEHCAAFEYIHDKYQQLQVVQRLTRLNVRALLEKIDLYTHGFSSKSCAEDTTH
jgi:hypothetical protein